MTTYSTPTPFSQKVYLLLEEIASYTYNNGDCGYTAAREFQSALNDACKKIASAPLQFGHDWGHPQRRSFFEYKSQYTLIFVFIPPTAQTNSEVLKIIFTDIYPSRSKAGNKSRTTEKRFDADDLLND